MANRVWVTWLGLSLGQFAFSGAAAGNIGLLMNESTGKGLSRLTSAGHSAVYLSNVCPASPVKLRLCKAGEQGSVISNYTNFGEASAYEWNIIPLSVFLYAVENPEDAPIYGNRAVLRLLQERYRNDHLSSVCPAGTCSDPASVAHWRDMVGGAFVRQIYLFQIKSTPEQDAKLVEEFNRMPNENKYNGFTRNCADFAKSLVNRYFPNSAKTDHLNDFGMTSPKAIAKSFTRYGEARPELEFTAEKFSQLPGDIKRSSPTRKGTEVSFRLKKWFIPLLLVHSHELPFFIAAYSLTGRFNPDVEVRRHPAEEAITSRIEWKKYNEEFREILDTAVTDGLFSNSRDVHGYFKGLDREGRARLDAEGRPVLDVNGRSVGMSRANLTSSESDAKTAYKVMLARVQSVLGSPAGRRESLSQFKADWDLLIRAREQLMGNAAVGN